MAPAQIPVFVSQKPGTKNKIPRAAILFLAWVRIRASQVGTEGTSHQGRPATLDDAKISEVRVQVMSEGGVCRRPSDVIAAAVARDARRDDDRDVATDTLVLLDELHEVLVHRQRIKIVERLLAGV